MDLGLKGKIGFGTSKYDSVHTIRAGVHAFAKSLATELAGDGILVNTVAPGRIMTDRTAELDRIKAEDGGMIKSL
ncbi:SDR family oxidoreductase [Paenibacillus naphthalenovorans]|uniref:NAD(P)-binding domain-containing protein n=1 Tax=Paenibacillus naphthalenovorans TaxID=162209 RepID=A0A0U2M743_9BACL|nr:NAD(P)-binding domain-containing protein [Paenibacillus naphthalenovorans]